MNVRAFAEVLAEAVKRGASEADAVARALEVAGLDRPLTLADVMRAKALRPDVFPPAIKYPRIVR